MTMFKNRRGFIKNTALASLGIMVANKNQAQFLGNPKLIQAGKRIGIIGLDTSHVVAFSKALNAENAGPEYGGFKIAAAYPKGSKDIASSVERIPGYTEDVKNWVLKLWSPSTIC